MSRTAVALTAWYTSALDARLPVDRGDVIHDLDPGGRRIERGAVADVPDRDLDALRLEVAGPAGIPNERAHCLAPDGQAYGPGGFR